jgi:hypothetical protein
MRASSLLVATTDSVTVVQVGEWKWHTCHRKCLRRCSLRILTSLCLGLRVYGFVALPARLGFARRIAHQF